MAILEIVCGICQGGVAFESAKAYGSTPSQAVIFSTINGIVESVLVFSVRSFLQNSRELALAAISIKVIAALAGMLATRVFCDRTIHWRQAVAGVAISNFTTRWLFCILQTPVPMPTASNA